VKGDFELFSCLSIDDVSTEAAKTERNTVEDVSNTELSCPEKGGFVENRNFKGDVELFSCLTFDAVPTETAKTEQDTVQDVSNTKLLCPEKGGKIQSLLTRTLESKSGSIKQTSGNTKRRQSHKQQQVDNNKKS
jgi:hypothetical protein